MHDFVENLRPKMSPRPARPAVPLTHFRVHFSDGVKHDVLAKDAVDAAKHAKKLHEGIVTKTKRVKSKTSS